MSHHLVGAAEVSEILSIARQRVAELVKSEPDFPAPVAELAAGRIWERVDIERWAARRQVLVESQVLDIAGVPVIDASALDSLDVVAEASRSAAPLLIDGRRAARAHWQRVTDFVRGLAEGAARTLEPLEGCLLLHRSGRQLSTSQRAALGSYLAHTRQMSKAVQLQDFLREHHGVVIGEGTAAEIIAVAEGTPGTQSTQGVVARVRGADTSGEPREVTVSLRHLASAIRQADG